MTGVVIPIGRYRAAIFSPVRPRMNVMTSSIALGSFAKANWGIRSRSSQALMSSLVLR